MSVMTASIDLFGFGHASMSPLPATASAEGAQLNAPPFPATASAEGAQFNVPPSLWERELVAPATPGQYNAR